MRKIKNIVMIILTILLIGTTTFTMFYIKNSSGSMGYVMMNSDDMNFSGEMPEGGSGEMPEMPEGEMGEAPEKPEGEMSEMPEMPEGEMAKLSEGAGGAMQMEDRGEMKGGTVLKVQHYVLFAVQCLLITVLIMYLTMSKFNKLTFKETFGSAKRIVLYIIISIVLTAGLTVGCVFLTNMLVKNQMENMMEELPAGEMANGMQPGGMDNTNVEYNGAETITEDQTITEGTFTSENVDENAILVSGEIGVSLSGITVEKSGDSDDGDESSFYGNNSAVIAKDGAGLNINGITVTTNGDGANGVFSYGGSATTNNTSSDGTTVTISDSSITTTGDNSGGIMTTGGGITHASNLQIHTSGISSAAIRTDRGGGTVTVDGGTYTTTGAGSPAVYSTAEIEVNDAELVSETAEGVVIEGRNTVVLNNCSLTDSNMKLNGLSTTYKNIFLYQSMSGDADSGNSWFTAENCDITTNNGDSFYITNTDATIILTNNTIVNNDAEGNFLRAQADSWGNEGENGGNVTLVLKSQDAVGNIVIDAVSTLSMAMEESYYEGTINGENSADNLELILDASSSIKLTGDSYVTSLECEDETYSNIDFNGFTLYVNGAAVN